MITRTFVVTRREAGQTLAAVLRAQLGLSWAAAKRLVAVGKVRIGTMLITDPVHRVKSGHRLNVEVEPGLAAEHVPRERRPAEHGKAPPQGKLKIVYVDTQVVVVEKPAGLTTMRHASETAEFGARARRFLPTTLADVLEKQLAAASGQKHVRLRAVHRLDKDTSGLVVFARTGEAERHLGLQFRAHTVGRAYLAAVRGRARSGKVESNIVTDRGDGRRGSVPSAADGSGKHAVTHVSVVEDLGAFTLVECRLETGRTHQVRIHLGESSTPICGETIYDRPLHGAPLPDASGAPRLALHAASLSFQHPGTGKRLSWTSPLPEDMKQLVDTLRTRARLDQ